MFIALQSDVFKFAGVVKFVEIFDLGVEPESGGWGESAGFYGLVVAGDLLADAGDLIIIDMCVVNDKGELAGLNANGAGDEITEDGVLDDVIGEA